MIIKITGLDDIGLDNYVKYNDRAMASAINKSASVSQTASLLATRKQGWRISARDLKANVKAPKRASVNSLHYIFTMDSSSIPLKAFKGTEYFGRLTDTNKKRTGGAGVKYLLKGKGRKKTLAKSFIKKSKFNNHRLEVFTRRKSPDGANITAQYAITPSSMFNQEGSDVYVKTFKDGFSKRYFNQLERFKIL